LVSAPAAAGASSALIVNLTSAACIVSPFSEWLEPSHDRPEQLARRALAVVECRRQLGTYSLGIGDSPLNVKLSGGYPLRQVDRLVRNLAPLIELDRRRPLVLDMSGLVGVGPTAIALLTAVTLRIAEEDLLGEGSRAILPSSPLTRNYLLRMDFVRLLTGEETPEPFERRRAVGFRPCQRFTGGDDYHSVAADLTVALSERCETDSLARASIRIALDELTENVVHHAESPIGGVAAAQGWPKRDAFEIGIVDLGIGIRASLTKNVAFADIEDDLTAISTALKPRVSSTPDRNAGIGLFITRLLLAANGGIFAIRSGKGAVYTGAGEREIGREVDFPGTMVAIRARTDRPLNIKEVYRQLDDDTSGNDD
jgi:anti-sigma regulatory factor (Ser/Thr protein kinase)